MRKASMFICVCMVVAVALTAYAQTRDIMPIMKEVGPAFTGLTTGMRGRTMSAADVAKDAEKLHNLFKEVGAFMKDKNLEKAAGWANDAATAAADLAKAAKDNDAEAMFSARNNIQKNCGACHAVHREQLPDKTYKMKVP